MVFICQESNFIIYRVLHSPIRVFKKLPWYKMSIFELATQNSHTDSHMKPKPNKQGSQLKR